MSVPCTACGHSITTRDPFFYRWEGGEHWIRRCSSCTHQFVDPPVTPAQQDRIYADHYFARDGDWAVDHFDGKSYQDAEAELVAEARDVLPWLEPYSGRLLDVGCAGGTFLAEAREAGFDVHGLEINAAMAESARERYDLAVTCSSIEAAGELGRFDVVTMMDVLEHVPAPLEALRKVHGWLRPGGVLFVRGPLVTGVVPRVKETVRRIIGREKQLPGYPLDANMFNRRSLTACMVAAGMTPVRWEQAPGFVQVVGRREG